MAKEQSYTPSPQQITEEECLLLCQLKSEVMVCAYGNIRMLCLSGGKAAQTCLYLQKLSVLTEKRGSPCFWCWRMRSPAWLINPKVKHYSVKNSLSQQKLTLVRMQQTELLIIEPTSDSTGNLSCWVDTSDYQSLYSAKGMIPFSMAENSDTFLLGWSVCSFLPWMGIPLQVTP